MSLGALSTFMYYVQPTTYRPTPGFASAYAYELVLVTMLGWAPYLLSWWVSLSVLQASPRGTTVFIVLASAITLCAAGFYIGIFAYHPSAIVVAGCVTVFLMLAVGVSFATGGHPVDR